MLSKHFQVSWSLHIKLGVFDTPNFIAEELRSICLLQSMLTLPVRYLKKFANWCGKKAWGFNSPYSQLLTSVFGTEKTEAIKKHLQFPLLHGRFTSISTDGLQFSSSYWLNALAPVWAQPLYLWIRESQQFSFSL